MDTYWHRLCKNLPATIATEGRALLAGAGQRPAVSRYLKLWQLVKPLGLMAEGLALLTEGTRLWPRANSIKLELARLYLDQGDGRRVTQLLSVADAQKDPACGLVVLKGALLCGKVEWVRVLAPSLALAKLDKAPAEEQCLALCHRGYWQDAADLVRRHHGLPAADPLQKAPKRQAAERLSEQGSERGSERAQGLSADDDGSFRAFEGCRSADLASLGDWLAQPEDQAWQGEQDQLSSPRAILVKKLLAAARADRPAKQAPAKEQAE